MLGAKVGQGTADAIDSVASGLRRLWGGGKR